MDEQRAVPEPWAAAFVAVGATDRRTGPGEAAPSFQALASLSGIHATTLAAMAYGTRRTSSKTIAAVAEALKLDVRVVAGWLGLKRDVREPYIPPAAANMLDRRQRAALDELIKAIAAGRGVSDAEDEQEPGTEAGGTLDGSEGSGAATPMTSPSAPPNLDAAPAVAEAEPQDQDEMAERRRRMQRDRERHPAAARTVERSRGRDLHDESLQRGEESQDTGGDDPL